MSNKFIEDINSFLIEIADYNLKNSENALKGNNGPYNDDDLPIRNTAHWIIIYIYLYKLTKKEEYLRIIDNYSNYLINDEFYSSNGCIKIRNNRDTDYTNGLIGEAWVIESLIECAKFYKNDIFYQKALKMFKAEQFDENLKLWKICDLDGTCKYIDFVYNHQLWFAGVGSKILDYKYDKTIDNQITLFLNNYKNNFGVQRSGLLFHQVHYETSLKSKISLYIKMILCDFKLGSRWKKQNELEEGYETFDFYGFALLYKRYNELDIFKSQKFKKAINYCLNESRFKKLYNNDYINKYSYPYNSPAFEYPFIALTFGYYNNDLANKLFCNQIDLTYSNCLLSKNTNDENTLTARSYEIVNFLNLMEDSNYEK